MLCGQLLYEQYLLDNPIVTQGKNKSKSIDREKFIATANIIGKDEDFSKYKSKDIARKELKRKARKSMGLIEYFLLRAIISWIIEKILSYYFLKDSP